MTLLFAPFLVIHVNAAYARMTGIEARQVLGKPLSDVFKDNRCKSIASNVSSLVTMDEQLTSVQSKGQSKRSNCRLHVSLVGTESDTTIAESEPVGITHYMIAVEPTAQTGLPTLTESNVPPAPVAQSRVHCEVVG